MPSIFPYFLPLASDNGRKLIMLGGWLASLKFIIVMLIHGPNQLLKIVFLNQCYLQTWFAQHLCVSNGDFEKCYIWRETSEQSSSMGCWVKHKRHFPFVPSMNFKLRVCHNFPDNVLVIVEEQNVYYTPHSI